MHATRFKSLIVTLLGCNKYLPYFVMFPKPMAVHTNNEILVIHRNFNQKRRGWREKENRHESSQL